MLYENSVKQHEMWFWSVDSSLQAEYNWSSRMHAEEKKEGC